LALAHVLRRLHRAGTPPWLHGEVARRMAERLSIVKLQPATVLAWAPRVGGGLQELQLAYPRAEVVAIEPEAGARLAPARGWWPWRRVSPAALAPAGVQPGAGQLVWSNMGLHGAADPQALMRQWQQALAVDGFLMFSTLGPGTLQPLRDLYRQQGWPVPHAPFVDMHDLGDMLVEAGFADPVMDQETLTLTWPTAEAALAELRSLGGNVAPQRHPGLRTPRWQRQLAAALQAQVGDRAGRVALPFELVYGHAFRPAPRPPLGPETAVSLDDMRAMVKRGGRSG
jgi:malonyl-CoA O-methyltransferase